MYELSQPRTIQCGPPIDSVAVVKLPRVRRARPPGMADRLAVVQARARLATELRSIAYDMLGPHGPHGLSRECATWLESATEGVVASVCDTSLRMLTDALDRALARATPDVVHGLLEAGARRDAGVF